MLVLTHVNGEALGKMHSKLFYLEEATELDQLRGFSWES